MKEQKYKSGFVTLIGRTNVGKSTLMNNIIGQKLQLHLINPKPLGTGSDCIYK